MFDIDYPRTVLLVVLVVVNLALIGAVSTSGAPYGPFNTGWDGTSDLRQTVSETDGEVTLAHAASEYEEPRPDQTVAFVVSPQREYGPTDVARVRQFLSRGGTLVVASDDNRTNRLLDRLGVETRIDGRPVRDDRNNFRGPSLPVATNVPAHPLTRDVDQLTLNYGTVLNVTRDRNRSTLERRDENRSTRILVNSSGFAYLDSNANGALDENEILREYPVVALERVGSGRVVVVSDGSVFTNAMLERDGNRQFARTLAAQHEHVLLDSSHGHPLPPLVVGLLVVRDTPLLQFALGGAALTLVALWTLRPSIRLPDWLSRDGATTGSQYRLDADELAAFLTERHPDWDDEQVERVTKAIIRRREQSGGND